jgi:hypothetical protein
MEIVESAAGIIADTINIVELKISYTMQDLIGFIDPQI